MSAELEAFLLAAEALARARAAGVVSQAQVDVAVAGAALSLGVDAVTFVRRTGDLIQDRRGRTLRGIA